MIRKLIMGNPWDNLFPVALLPEKVGSLLKLHNGSREILSFRACI